MVVLPTKRKNPLTDFNQYSLLIYGREKIGKSTLFSSFPDILFLTTEPGTKGLEIFETPVENWREILQVVTLLKKGDHKFKRVVFDTIDRAYDMCLDYKCRELGIEYPGITADGKEDFGKSWKMIKQEFMNMIHELSRLKLGVSFTSHAVESEIISSSGEKYTRVYPSMSKQARGIIEALVDFFFYAEYVRTTDNAIKRVLITQGDETVWAGSRQGIQGVQFPRIIEIKRGGGYEELLNCFSGKSDGMDVTKLLTHRTTTKAGGNLLTKLKAVKIADTRNKKQPLKKIMKTLPKRKLQ